MLAPQHSTAKFWYRLEQNNFLTQFNLPMSQPGFHPKALQHVKFACRFWLQPIVCVTLILFPKQAVALNSVNVTWQCPNVPQGCIHMKENFSEERRKENPVFFYNVMKCHISANASHLPHPIIFCCFVRREFVCTHLPHSYNHLTLSALCFAHATVGCGIQKNTEWWRDKTGKRMSLLMLGISAKTKQTPRVKIILSGR